MLVIHSGVTRDRWLMTELQESEFACICGRSIAYCGLARAGALGGVPDYPRLHLRLLQEAVGDFPT